MQIEKQREAKLRGIEGLYRGLALNFRLDSRRHRAMGILKLNLLMKKQRQRRRRQIQVRGKSKLLALPCLFTISPYTQTSVPLHPYDKTPLVHQLFSSSFSYHLKSSVHRLIDLVSSEQCG